MKKGKLLALGLALAMCFTMFSCSSGGETEEVEEVKLQQLEFFDITIDVPEELGEGEATTDNNITYSSPEEGDTAQWALNLSRAEDAYIDSPSGLQAILEEGLNSTDMETTSDFTEKTYNDILTVGVHFSTEGGEGSMYAIPLNNDVYLVTFMAKTPDEDSEQEAVDIHSMAEKYIKTLSGIDRSKMGTTFEDDVLKTPDFTLTFTGSEVYPADELYSERLILFYDITNDSNENLDIGTELISHLELTQETETSVEDVYSSIVPDEYASLDAFNGSELKPGATISGAIAYDLNNTDSPVKMTIVDDSYQDVATKTYEIK